MSARITDEELDELESWGTSPNPSTTRLVVKEIRNLQAALIEATAELIYLRQHGKDGAVWWANDSKDVWRGKAIAALSLPSVAAPSQSRTRTDDEVGR